MIVTPKCPESNVQGQMSVGKCVTVIRLYPEWMSIYIEGYDPAIPANKVYDFVTCHLSSGVGLEVLGFRS